MHRKNALSLVNYDKPDYFEVTSDVDLSHFLILRKRKLLPQYQRYYHNYIPLSIGIVFLPNRPALFSFVA